MAGKTRSETMEETRNRLLQSARRSFGVDGYAATVMDELTAAAGVTRGALYHHFGDKKGLLLAVAQALDAEIEAGLARAECEAADPWQGFKRRCRAYLQAVTQPEAQRILLYDAPAALGAEYVQAGQRQCVGAIAERLRALMDAGLIRPADPQALARLINGALVEGACWASGAEQPAAALAQTLDALEILLEGLRLSA
ncbi:TetR/AcrR family transcriptional regulator [Chromobacterium haemolyticum]|uniref:TetR/AcrR family transcriptional regulator n=1 Tax=Chromobacterium haemolyticum TaxID=394935 RepID=UPI0005B91FD7|nr:TetR/AcrR family transcriptional regulator [Chromobacterium haemolyticum]MDH0343460.1 TetR/AcrR family transcriptional regulator [Chromobacterium haemolyticum]PTU69200.1 TetR/AcrR family transcriptional regulator [Chromobacterium haemolyticum]BBH13012.1 TetR family transcriptional regulator [Chromobacterium haemolyticum]